MHRMTPARSILALLTLVLGSMVCAHGEPALRISVSKRVPSLGDTVRIAAHLQDWQKPDTGSRITFSAELNGEEQPIGKALLAVDSTLPFQPSVEWSPRANGLYRMIARLEDSDLIGRLLVPVVAQEVFFCWYGETRPEVNWITHHLTASKPEIDELKARGVMALRQVGGVSYVGGPRWENTPTDINLARIAPTILTDYTETDPWDGIAIDELGMWDDHPAQTELALGFWEVLKQAREARPDQFFAAWQFGALTPLECNIFRDTMDLIICEVYQNHFRAWYDQHTFYEYIKQRIDVARAMAVMKKTIIGLSISTDYGGITPEELEDQIRYIRATAPEMRGLAFYTTSRCDDEVLKRANDCCYRYFIKPVVGLLSDADLSLSDYSPQHHGMVRILATVHNVGGTDARNVKVRFWDGDPAYGGVQVGGTQVIPRLPAAKWVDPKALDNASWDPPEAMRRDGFGMVTVSVPWRALSGSHDLWVEIVPSPQYTTIQAFQSRRTTVQ